MRAMQYMGYWCGATKFSFHEVGLESGLSPVLWKSWYGNRVPRCKIDYFSIGESWRGMLLEQKLESEG